MKLVGEVLADVKRRDLAEIDCDLLRLKRNVLAENLEEFKSNLETSMKQLKARAEQDLISRGLGNTTVRESSLRAIDNQGAIELEKAVREYNRGVEEIALLERKVAIEMRPHWWKKLFAYVASRVRDTFHAYSRRANKANRVDADRKVRGRGGSRDGHSGR